MRVAVTSNKFRKDLRRCQKRQYDLSRFSAISDLLIADEPLPISCRAHKLSGDYAGYWECHIGPDWLLIYQLPDDEDIVRYERMGTHSDLFR